MQRAREQGYTIEAYHGTRRDFDEFDVNEAGSNFSQDEGTIHFTDDAKDADRYAMSDTTGMPAEGGSTYPVLLRMKKPLVADRAFFEREGMGNVYANEDRISAWDTYHPFLKERAEEMGADGIILKDSFGKSHYVVFDPKNVRSKFATFDPSQSGSSKLLAGMGKGTGGRIASQVGPPAFAATVASVGPEGEPYEDKLKRMGVAALAASGARNAGAIMRGVNALKGGAKAAGRVPEQSGFFGKGPPKPANDAKPLKGNQKAWLGREMSDEDATSLMLAKQSGMKDAELAKAMKISVEDVPLAIERAREVATLINPKKVRTLRQQGVADEEIARQIGWSAEETDPASLRSALDALERKAIKAEPPSQAGFFSGGKGPPKNPNALAKAANGVKSYMGRPVMEPRVAAHLKRVGPSLPPEVRKAIADNAAKPPAMRRNALDAAGGDPSVYRLAAPFMTGSNAGRASRVAPTMEPDIKRGNLTQLDKQVYNAKRQSARTSAEAPLEQPMNSAMDILQNAERERRAAVAAAQRKANELNPYVNEAAGIPDKPLPKAYANREEAATNMVIAARQMAEQMGAKADDFAWAANQNQKRLEAIERELMSGQIDPAMKLDKPRTRQEAKDMAKLIFDAEYAGLLDDVLSGRVVPKQRSPYQAALLTAATGGITVAGIAAISSAMNKDQPTQSQPEPDYENPGDPRFVWDWEKLKSKRNRAMEEIQLNLMALPPNKSGGIYHPGRDGKWGPRTEAAIKNWLFENGQDPNGPFTLEHFEMLAEQALQARRATKAAPSGNALRGTVPMQRTPATAQ